MSSMIFGINLRDLNPARGHYTKRKKLYAKRRPSPGKDSVFRVLTPGSFILGSFDDVMAFAASVVTIFPLGAATGNLEFCLEGKGYPIGLLLAAQGSAFIQALQAFGGKSAG